MNANEIVKALRADCEDCSECGVEDKQCYGLYYCPNRDAADLIESQAAKIAELNDFQNSQCAKLLEKLGEAERRERAAVEDLAEGGKCPHCKYGKRRSQRTGFTICDLGYEYPRQGCFVWRGPQEAGKGE